MINFKLTAKKYPVGYLSTGSLEQYWEIDSFIFTGHYCNLRQYNPLPSEGTDKGLVNAVDRIKSLMWLFFMERLLHGVALKAVRLFFL